MNGYICLLYVIIFLSHFSASNGQCPPRNRCNARSKYRTVDGSCNNLNITFWGQSLTRLARLLPARYSNRVDRPRLSATGGPLPNARGLHLKLLPFGDVESDTMSLFVMQWGQLIAHDTVLSAGQRNAGNCCAGGRAQVSPACISVPLARQDPFYRRFNRTCMSITRTVNTRSNGCNITPVQQVNAVTHFIDVSPLYGSQLDVARRVRAFSGGLLKTRTINGKEFCPSAPNNNCDPRARVCYMAGDVRANQHPGISTLQVLLLREHNRIARELSRLNPQWNDETIFQESRRIVIAEVQQITYYEWLPIILGKPLQDVLPNSSEYDAKVDPSTLNSFTTGCYRYFHSLVQGIILLMNEDGDVKREVFLREFFNRPDVTQNDFDGLLLGMAKQPSQEADEFYTPSLGNFLFKATRNFGDDLEGIDISRGRDHGLPSYNSIRQFCGAPRAEKFSDYEDLIPKNSVSRIASAYANVEDVDLFIGTTYESKLPNSMYGPTCRCIFAEQFRRWKVGDRYFFENQNQIGSFRPNQIRELKKATLARLICDNGNAISKMQANAFQLVSRKNSVESCSNLPIVSLSPWMENQS